MARTYKAPVFQHRQYAEIAGALAKTRAALLADDKAGHAALMEFEVRMIGIFKCDNGKFDATRFRAASTGQALTNKDKR